MVLGGRGEDGATLSSTEVWSVEAGDWVSGPSLPWPLEQSCVVSLNTTHILIPGGLTSLEPIHRLDSAYFFDIRWAKKLVFFCQIGNSEYFVEEWRYPEDTTNEPWSKIWPWLLGNVRIL